MLMLHAFFDITLMPFCYDALPPLRHYHIFRRHYAIAAIIFIRRFDYCCCITLLSLRALMLIFFRCHIFAAVYICCRRCHADAATPDADIDTLFVQRYFR